MTNNKFRETIRNLSEEQRKIKGIKPTTMQEYSEQATHKSFTQQDLIYSRKISNYLISLQLQEPLTRIFFDVTRKYNTRFEYLLLISNIAQINSNKNEQKVILKQNKSSNTNLIVLKTQTNNLEEKLGKIRYKKEEQETSLDKEQNYKNKYSVLLNVKQILTYKEFEGYEKNLKNKTFESSENISDNTKGIYLLAVSETAQEANLIDLVKNIYPTKTFFREKITKPRRKKYLNEKHRQKIFEELKKRQKEQFSKAMSAIHTQHMFTIKKETSY